MASSLAAGKEPPRPAEAERRAALADDAKARLQRKLVELEALQADIGRLRADIGAAPQQLLIQVRMLEISRTRLAQLGFDLGDGGVAGLLNRSTRAEVEAASADSAPASPAKKPQNRAGPLSIETHAVKDLLESWQKQGAVVRVLAEPTVVTVAGRPASFRVGGEFPVVRPTADEKLRTEHRFYGTQLDAAPVVLPDGGVKLELKAGISALDANQAIEAKGISVPGRRIREIDTAIQLKPGQTCAVSGFCQARQADKSGQPGESSLDQSKDEIELLVLVTVEFIDAMVPTTAAKQLHNGHAETPR